MEGDIKNAQFRSLFFCEKYTRCIYFLFTRILIKLTLNTIFRNSSKPVVHSDKGFNTKEYFEIHPYVYGIENR